MNLFHTSMKQYHLRLLKSSLRAPMGNVRDVVAPNIAKHPQLLFIFIILMYICNLSPSHYNSFSWRCNLSDIILNYPKIVSRSPMAVLQWTPTLFSATLCLSHPLSLSLWCLACFPFFPFEYKYDVSEYYLLLRF